MEGTRKENKMGVMPVGKLLVNMSLPIMISMFVQALYNVVDNIFVAQIGEQALAAVSLAFPVQTLMIAVSVGTGVGINSLLSRRLGEKRYEDANAAATNGVFLCVVSSLAFALFRLFFCRCFSARLPRMKPSLKWASNTWASVRFSASAYSCRWRWSAFCRPRALPFTTC